MNTEQEMIQAAYMSLITQLTEMRDRYMREAEYGAATRDDYEGMSEGDAFVWFIEGIS